MKSALFFITLSYGVSSSFVGADLLFHEPFDYPAGTLLNGLVPPLGGSGGWVDTSSGDGTPGGSPLERGMTVRANGTTGGAESLQIWEGIPSSSLFLNTGGYLEGLRRDNNEAHIALDPTVTSQFTDGATIWLSYVAAATVVNGANDNNHEPTVAIGSDPIGGTTMGGSDGDDRARVSQGEAVGAGSLPIDTTSSIRAAYWDDQDTVGVHELFMSDLEVERITPQQLIVVRIEFGAESEVMTTNVFSLDPFETPTLADFEDGASEITTPSNLDQTLFDTLSFDAVRTNLDEIRIGTTFEDAIGIEAGGPSPLIITEITRATDSVTFRWNSIPGQLYIVEASSSLEEGAWFELSDFVEADTSQSTTSFTELESDGFGLTPETTVRFYRVRIAE